MAVAGEFYFFTPFSIGPARFYLAQPISISPPDYFSCGLFIALMMEAVRMSETSIRFNKNIRRCIQEGYHRLTDLLKTLIRYNLVQL
jgi:hypothetical protein